MSKQQFITMSFKEVQESYKFFFHKEMPMKMTYQTALENLVKAVGIPRLEQYRK